MKLVTSSSVAVSLGSRGRKRMTSSGAGARRHDDEAQHEQGVGKQRADDRGLGDDDLARAQREDDHEELGRLPSVDCSTPVAAGPKRSPTCSVASETRWARPARAMVADREGEQRRPVRVVGDPGQRGRHGDRGDDAAAPCGSALPWRQRGYGSPALRCAAMLRLALARLRARGRLTVSGRPGWAAACASTWARRGRRPRRRLPRRRRCRFHLGAGAAVAIGAGARLGERCVVAAHERIEIGARARLGDEVVLIDSTTTSATSSALCASSACSPRRS